MRAFVSSLIGLLLLFLVGVAAAQSPTLIISPDVIPIGEPFNVTADGLKPNTTYTFAIVEMANETSVYERESTSNASGRLALSLTTEVKADRAGTYRVELRENDTVIIGEEFELQQGADPTETPPSSSGDATLDIFPTEGVVGAAFEILVSDLTAGQTATIAITGPDGSEVYSTDREVADDGSVDVKIFTEATDAPGIYTVTATSGDVVSEGTFVLTSLGGREGTVTVEQQTKDDIPSYSISIENVQPFADLTVTVEAPGSPANSEPLFEGRVRASVDGKAVVDFTLEEGTTAGTYDVVVLDRDTQVGTAELTIDEETLALVGGPVLRITPSEGEAGTLRLITVSGLNPSETVTIEISLGDNVVSTQDQTADVNGTVAFGLRDIGDNSDGVYTVSVLRGETAVATGTLTVGTAAVQEPAADVTVTIDPASGEIGSAHNVRIEGLTAGEAITINVTFDGQTVYTTEKTADADGVVVMRLSTDVDDPAGVYTVTVSRAGEEVASADLDVTEAAAQPEATLEPSNLPDVTITVDPESGPQGTQHVIRAEGLPASIAVSFDLMLGDRVVFTSEKTSSPEGIVEFSIETEEGDTPGDYTVVVRQGDVTFASTTLTIESASAQPGVTQTPEATVEPTEEPLATEEPSGTETPVPPVKVEVTAEPAAGPRGTTHNIMVTGLLPDEVVQYEVLFDGQSILTGEATADVMGNALIPLTSDETDPLGDYTIEVRHDDALLGTVTITIEEGTLEGTATPQPDADITVQIEPSSGIAGTSHEVTVTGLPAGETAFIQVKFNDEVVYTTSKTASDEGVVTFSLVTAEDDEIGTYTVDVLVDDEVVGSSDLEVILEENGDENTGPEGAPATQTPETNVGPEGQDNTETVTPTDDSTLLIDVTETLSESEAQFTFEAEAGDSIIASVTSPDFDSYLTLLGPDGTELAYNDDFNGLDAQIGPFPLPETGEYTVVLSSYSMFEDSATTGEFTLQVRSITLQEITPDTAQSMTFSPETQMYYFSFDAEVGDVIDVVVTSDDGVDTVLTLTDAQGAVITGDDDSGTGYNPEIYQFTLGNAGSYTILVSTTDTTGTAEMTLSQEGAPTLDEGGQEVKITPKLYTRALTYEAQAGETVLLSVSVTEGEAVDVTISAYQGDVTLMSYSTSRIPEGTVLGFDVPEDGQVEIFVSGSNPGAVTVELSVDQ
jgi:hypothetical protein